MPFLSPATAGYSATQRMDSRDVTSKARNIKRKRKRSISGREHRDPEPDLSGPKPLKKKRKNKMDKVSLEDVNTDSDLRHVKASEAEVMHKIPSLSSVRESNHIAAGTKSPQTDEAERVYVSQKERKATKKALKHSRKIATAAEESEAGQDKVVLNSQPSPPASPRPIAQSDGDHSSRSAEKLVPIINDAPSNQSSATLLEPLPGKGTAPKSLKASKEIASPSRSEDSARAEKMRTAIRKYLRHSKLSESDLSLSLDTTRIAHNPFFSFAKKYFARDDEETFERLIRSALSSDLEPVASTKKRSRTLAQNIDKAAATGFTKTAKSSKSDKAGRSTNAYEIAHQEFAESGQPYIKGPFSKEEENTLRASVEEYCQEHDLSRIDFCNILHSNVPQKEKNNLYANFIYLFNNRKSKNVKDHLRRAYLPYERNAFTEEDDEKIFAMRNEFGADWVAIAGELGRYANDVRDRYRNHLATSASSTGAWSPEENAKFDQILETFSSKDEMNWEAIAAQMGTRTRAQCRDRFLRLQGEKSKSQKPRATASKFEALLPTKLTSKKSVVDTTKPSRKKAVNPMSPRMSRNAILPGDLLHMLSLMQTSKQPNIRSAIAQNLFSEYDNVFEKSEIRDRLSRELGSSKATPAEKLKRAIAKLRGPGTELKRTLVQDSENES